MPLLHAERLRLSTPWQRCCDILTGWVNRRQPPAIACLRTENRALKERFGMNPILPTADLLAIRGEEDESPAICHNIREFGARVLVTSAVRDRQIVKALECRLYLEPRPRGTWWLNSHHPYPHSPAKPVSTSLQSRPDLAFPATHTVGRIFLAPWNRSSRIALVAFSW